MVDMIHQVDRTVNKIKNSWLFGGVLFMKTVRIFLLLSCFGTSINYLLAAHEALPVNLVSTQNNVRNNFQIWKINRPTIDAQKKVIRNYLKRNARDRVIVRAALTTAFAAGVGYWYWTYYRTSTPTPLPAGAPLILTPETGQELCASVRAVQQGLAANQIGLLKVEKALEVVGADKFKKPVDEISKGVAAAVMQAGKDAAVGTYNFIYGIGQYFYAGIPQAIAGGFVAHLIFRDLPTVLSLGKDYIVKPIRRINHPHSLEWFLVTQVKVERARYRIDIERPYPGENNENVGYRLNYDKFFGNISRTASVLPLASDEFERGHYVASVVTDLNFLLRQVARIIAFCEIRTETVSAHNKTCGRHLKEETAYVLKLTEKLGNDVASLLVSTELHIKIPALIEDFKFKIAEQLESFSLYEQAAFLDFTPAE
jgi:hypothetical protein